MPTTAVKFGQRGGVLNSILQNILLLHSIVMHSKEQHTVVQVSTSRTDIVLVHRMV